MALALGRLTPDGLPEKVQRCHSVEQIPNDPREHRVLSHICLSYTDAFGDPATKQEIVLGSGLIAYATGDDIEKLRQHFNIK